MPNETMFEQNIIKTSNLSERKENLQWPFKKGIMIKDVQREGATMANVGSLGGGLWMTPSVPSCTSKR